MFMSPHFYQAILEVRLTKPGSAPQALYLDDRETTGTKMYGFNPDQEFVLPDLVSTDPQRPRVTRFSGTLWRGALRRRGTRAEHDRFERGLHPTRDPARGPECRRDEARGPGRF